MESFLKSLVQLIGAINEFVGRSVAWLTTVLVLLVCFDVIVRYIFNDTAAWIMELEWHLFALIFLLGAGYALKHDRHVRVDLFYTKFSKREKAWVNLIGGLVFLIPWCLIVIKFSFDFALESYYDNETSPDPGGLPARYLIKFAITTGISLLLLQGIATIAESILVLMNKSVDEEQSFEINEKL